jgi:hypothetical protein
MNAVGVVSGGRCLPAPPAPAEGLSRFRGNLILKHFEDELKNLMMTVVPNLPRIH